MNSQSYWCKTIASNFHIHKSTVSILLLLLFSTRALQLPSHLLISTQSSSISQHLHQSRQPIHHYYRRHHSYHRRQNHYGNFLTIHKSTTISNVPPVTGINDDVVKNNLDERGHNINRANNESSGSTTPLSMSLEELTKKMGGKGRALTAWDCFRIGLDPLFFHDPSVPEEVLDSALNGLIPSSSSNSFHTIKTTRSDLEQYIPAKRRTERLGSKSLNILSKLYPVPSLIAKIDASLRLELGGIESSIAKLVQIQTSSDGTTKLLLNLYSSPTHFIEAVIIPWHDRGHSTLCVSSQVGCRQGCTFCATGRMGRLLDLTTDEILIQLYYANKICRVLRTKRDDDSVPLLPPIDNIVFMGMGEPTDNLQSVIPSVHHMVSQTGAGFQLSPAKVTVSTVAPTPHVFRELATVPATLAWSVHAVRDSLRKELVPTTRYSMAELRQGLVEALRSRRDWGRKMWSVMLEVALIEGVNDSAVEAEELADFSIGLVEEVGGRKGRGGIKLIVNLIPFNDIGHEKYRSPNVEQVLAFQKVLVDKGVMTYVRTTRGDDESAACGQLATKRTTKRFGE